MTKTQSQYEPTPEDLKKWAELDELGMTAMAGRPFTDEEYNARVQSVIDGSCFQKYLNNILQQKEETRKKLTALEETEQMLRTTIGEIQIRSLAGSDYRIERLEHYRQCIRKLLTEQATIAEANPEVECQLIFDTEHDHYQLLDVGWEDLKRIYNCFIHLDIKNGKIWIQRNMTEIDIGQKLVDMGVSKEEIVLGLHPPYKRPYTGYGVA